MKTMKRTNFVTKLIAVILFVFLAVYFGLNLLQYFSNPLVTAPAVTMQSHVSFTVPGLIVREEELVDAPYPIVASLVEEGARVSVGMAYLAAYSSEADLGRDMRRRQIEREIAELEAHVAAGDGPEQLLLAEAEIRRQLKELHYAVNQGNLRDLEARSIALNTLALLGDRGGLDERLGRLRSELDALGPAANVRYISASRSGVYSTRVDGFEHIGPGDLPRMDAFTLKDLLEWRPLDVEAGAGKLILRSTWYYVALVPEEEAQWLYSRFTGELPNQVTLTFSGLEAIDVDMRIHAMGPPEEDGVRVFVFASITGLRETLGLRQTEARVTYATFSGIRVPKEALRRGEPDPETGEAYAYVFTLMINVAEQKFVEVIYEGQDYYLVRPDLVRTPAYAALRDGNTIIVRGSDLHDGRVVR